MSIKEHFIRNISVYNILYTGGTTIVLSSGIILLNGTIPTMILIAIGVCSHNIINKLKDKISEKDSSSALGKVKVENTELKTENTELKNQISTKEAMLVALRTELINHSIKPSKEKKQDAEKLINGILIWCGETSEMNTMKNLTEENTTKQRQNIRKYLEEKIDKKDDTD